MNRILGMGIVLVSLPTAMAVCATAAERVVGNADADQAAAGALVALTFDNPANLTEDAFGHGAELRAAKVDAAAPAAVTDAVRGKVASFDGTNFFEIPTNGSTVAWAPRKGESFTIALWLKPTPLADGETAWDRGIIGWGCNKTKDPCTANTMARLVLGKAGDLQFQISNGGSGSQVSGNLPIIRDGGWHFVAVTYANNGDETFSTRVYCDDLNAPVFSGEFTTSSISLPHHFEVGAMTPFFSGTYKGLLDDVTVLPSAATAETLAALKDGRAFRGTASGDTVEFAANGRIRNAGDSSAARISGAGLRGGADVVGDFAVGQAADGTAVFAGSLDGTGNLVKAGEDSTLVLEGVNGLAGTVAVEGGTLALRRDVADDGLVAYWPLDAATDPQHDATGNGWNLTDGTYEGRPYRVAPSASMPPTMPVGNSPFTASIWIRPTADCCANRGAVFRWGDFNWTQNAGKFVNLILTGTSSIRWGSGSTCSLAANVPAGGAVDFADGAWHQIVSAYDGQFIHLYVDGVFWKKMDVTEKLPGGLSVTWNDDLYVGYSNKSLTDGSPFVGGLRDFALYARALTADEIAASYAQPSLADSVAPTPKAHWKFAKAAPGKDEGELALNLTASVDTLKAFEQEGADGEAVDFSKVGAEEQAYYALRSGNRWVTPSGLLASNGAFTVSIRVKPPAAASAERRMLFQLGQLSSVKYFAIDIPANATEFRACFGGNSAGTANDCWVDFTGRESVLQGKARLDWVNLTAVYEPQRDERYFIRRVYVDGVEVAAKEKEATDKMNAFDASICEVGQFIVGGTTATKGIQMTAVDDVQVFDRALADGEIRALVRSLETGFGKAGGPVVPATAAVSVASGAKLSVEADQTLAALTGSGLVDVAAGRTFTLADASGFAGVLAGDGTVAMAEGFSATTDGSAPVFPSAPRIRLPKAATVVWTGGAPGSHVLVRADDALAGDVSGWTLDNRTKSKVRLMLSADGRSVLAKVSGGLILIFR